MHGKRREFWGVVAWWAFLLGVAVVAHLIWRLTR